MRRLHLAVKLACGIALIGVLAAPAAAQVERASIVGTIRDGTGAVVPGVSIRVTHESTNTTTTLQSSGTGNYTAVNLIPGSYTVVAEHTGFSTRSFKGVVLQVGQTGRLDITLEVGAMHEVIEISAAAPMLQTENATVGQVIPLQPIQDLPLNGRNFVQLAILAPGVTGLDFAPAGGINSGKRNDELRPGGTGLQASGVSMMNNQVLVDGIDDTELISGTFVVRPTIEGVQEFRVITNNAGAEYGRAGGAIVVVNSKSGGNEFHGSAFEFVRNDFFDAKNYFDRPETKIPPYRMNQFGASLGGPVLLPRYNGRNRTFFFTDYEGQREVLGQTQTLTVPSAAMRTGNFEGVVSNGIFDPSSTRANPSGTGYIRDRFPGDQIPANRFDPLAAKLINLYPLPQKTAPANNYVANPIKRSALERGNIRIDHQFTSRDVVFARYSIDQAIFTMPDTFNSDIGGSDGSFAGPADERGQNAVIANTHSFTPNVIGDFRFGYTRTDYELFTTKLTNPVWSQIPGRDLNDPYQPTAPIISPSGWGGLGNSRSLPTLRYENMKAFIGNVMWQKGSHNLKFGGELRRRYLSEAASPPGQSAFGRFSFDSGLTNNPAAPSGTGHVGASMLLGYPSTTVRDFFIPLKANLYTQEYNSYFRDQWRVNRRLTLNLGVHYEVNTPFVEKDNYWVNFDPGSAVLLLAGKNASRTANVNTDLGGIGPRISFALEATPKTILRGGYGRFFDPQLAQNNVRQERQWPFDFVYSLTPGALFPGNTVSQGFPKLADVPAIDPNDPFGNIAGMDPNFGNAVFQQYNLTLQRQLTSTVTLTVSYVGANGIHLAIKTPLNLPDPGPGGITQRRPYFSRLPRVISIAWLEASATSAYDSLQTSFEKRFSSGLYVLGNWTWGHARDNISTSIPTNRRGEWASTDSDARHRVNLSWRYTLPLGPGQRFLNQKNVAGYIAGGWEVAGITVLQSGYPFTVSVSGDPTNTGSVSRADVVPGVNPQLSNRSPNLWFNPSAFTFPTNYRYGNLGRNTLTGPPVYNSDFTLSRKFNITEQCYVSLRGEVYNAFNTPQFGNPSSTLGSSGVGTISSTVRSARQMQFALKLVW